MGNEKIVLKSDFPKSELESLARCFLPSIQAFFETEEGKREYEEWKTEQEKINANKSA